MATRESDPRRDRVQHIPSANVSRRTSQSAGMRRLEAISGATVGSQMIWMGESHIEPATRSATHHHGESETGIFVLRGNPVFIFLVDGAATRVETEPGDYVFVPPFVAHREENPSSQHDAVVILARSTQEAIVVNLPDFE